MVLFVSTAETAQSKITVSWGKEGVTYDDYRADAKECGLAGVSDRESIKNNPATKRALAGFRQQDIQFDNARGDTLDSEVEKYRDYALTYRRSIRPNVHKLQKDMVSIVEQCLSGKGYSIFLLNSTQTKYLKKLKLGSEDRYKYLHRFASDDVFIRENAGRTTNSNPVSR